MRILVLNYEYPPIGGGGGFVTRDILEHIAELGHNVTILTSAYKGLEKQENVNGVNIIRVPVLFRKKMEVANIVSMLSYFPSSVFKSIYSLKRGMFDIINTHFAIPSGPAGFCLSRVFKLPNVLSIHGGDIFDPSKRLSPHKTPILSHTVSAMLNTADSVVAQSRNTRESAYKYYRPNADIDIIPLCIKKPVFTKKTRRELGFRDDEIIFSSVGRLIARKNIGDMLKVLSGFKEKFDFKLLIMGDGPENLHIENTIKQYGLETSVLMMGNVTDEKKYQLLDISDIYLSTSLHEGFGLVFLEAMECGLPVVCYNRGGQNDFLRDGETGFLVELGDTNLYAGRVKQLVADLELRRGITQNNRKLVQSYYANVCAESYISHFEKVIEQKHKKA